MHLEKLKTTKSSNKPLYMLRTVFDTLFDICAPRKQGLIGKNCGVPGSYTSGYHAQRKTQNITMLSDYQIKSNQNKY